MKGVARRKGGAWEDESAAQGVIGQWRAGKKKLELVNCSIFVLKCGVMSHNLLAFANLRLLYFRFFT